MKLKALIFDFDGLILDTESPRFAGWRETYRRYGCVLDVEEYARVVGSDDSRFDFYQELERKSGRKIDGEAENAVRRKLITRLVGRERLLPGVREMIEAGRAAGLRLAVASSSPREWVAGHLERLGILGRFDCVVTIEDAGVAKPDPRLFLVALDRLGAARGEAVVFEDSPNGCLAAKNAGLFCVAVPNKITSRLVFPAPDLTAASLAAVTLDEILTAAEKRLRNPGP